MVSSVLMGVGGGQRKVKRGYREKTFSRTGLELNLEGECLSICRLESRPFWKCSSCGLRQQTSKGTPDSLEVVWCGLRRNTSKGPASGNTGESGQGTSVLTLSEIFLG